jgi:hypothetical protein
MKSALTRLAGCALFAVPMVIAGGVGLESAAAAPISVCNYSVGVSQTVANGSYVWAGIGTGGQSYINGSFIGNAATSTTVPSTVQTYLNGSTMYVLFVNTTGATQTYNGWANFQTSC